MSDIPFGRPDITDVDRAAVMRVLEGHILTHGPECKSFEADFGAFLGAGANCVSVSSCMAALHLAYLHFKLGAGDEVIAPACTHVATVHAIEWVGAKPILVDPDPKTGNLTAAGIEAALTPRTKAVSLVHFVGIPCDMDEIVALCEKRGLKLVEDCAIAIGARYKGKHVGLFGDVGTFSFYPVKHITTGEGGMFLSRHADVATQVARLRAFGVDRTHSERSIPGMYEVPSLGLNYRMSEMQAALGRTQTAKLPAILSARKANFDALKKHLAGIDNVRVLDSQSADAVQSHYCLVAVLEGALGAHRNALITHLNAAGIGTSIYYPQPVPRMKYYKDKYGYEGDKYPVATQISDCSIALPVGPHLRVEQMAEIATGLKAAIAKVSA
ncbi:MAG TPA: DegT/DnrJ/EryC1/StrS family aminotransferase [Kofleriaceae bacterium]|jgi:dTDP-4-amino-4,6-dideoxygalactose transaminase